MKPSQGTGAPAYRGAYPACPQASSHQGIPPSPALRWPRLGAVELFLLATAGSAVLILVIALHRFALYSDALLGS